jgi:hypothetical protein
VINFTIFVAGRFSFLPILISDMYGLYSLNRITAFAWKYRRHWSNKIDFIVLPQEGSSAEFENFVFLIKNEAMQNAQHLLLLYIRLRAYIPKINDHFIFLVLSNGNMNSHLYSSVAGYIRSIYILRYHPGKMYNRPICGRITGAYTNLGDLQRDLMGV